MVGPGLSFHLKQLNNWTKAVKQSFLDIQQQTEQDSDTCKKVNQEMSPNMPQVLCLQKVSSLHQREEEPNRAQ